MNLSGQAIAQACAFYKIPPENVIVISDDISLEIGRMRVRKNGSAGGHNGLKSVIECLKSQDFPRIKLGVGQKPSPEYPLTDWVLGKIPKESESAFNKVLQNVPGALELMLNGNTEKAMCDYNGIDTAK
jgi:PTH1 family peptidyl-tRNA hydrolase